MTTLETKLTRFIRSEELRLKFSLGFELVNIFKACPTVAAVHTFQFGKETIRAVEAVRAQLFVGTKRDFGIYDPRRVYLEIKKAPIFDSKDGFCLSPENPDPFIETLEKARELCALNLCSGDLLRGTYYFEILPRPL